MVFLEGKRYKSKTAMLIQAQLKHSYTMHDCELQHAPPPRIRRNFLNPYGDAEFEVEIRI